MLEAGVAESQTEELQGVSQRGLPHFCELYLLKLNQILTENVEKNLFLLLKDDGVKNHFCNKPENSVLHRTSPLQKLFYQSLICWGLSEPNYQGDGK